MISKTDARNGNNSASRAERGEVLPRGSAERDARSKKKELAATPRRRKGDRALSARGMAVPRYFTRAGINPFDELEWELRTAAITGEGGQVYFEQKDVEVPASWSQMATNVVVQKYFRGVVGTPSRERSVK